MSAKKMNNKRKKIIIQWISLPIVFIVLIFGVKYPLLGLFVPVVMLTGLITSIFKSRYMCANFCPRGSFLDRLIAKISPSKKIPKFFINPKFRWALFAVFMGLSAYRVSLNPTDLTYIGGVAWMMCTVTTGIALILSVFIHQRTWCSFCPMGTLQNSVGKLRKSLTVKQKKCSGCVTSDCSLSNNAKKCG